MKIALKSFAGRYVCAEEGGNDEGLIHVNRDIIGPWEIFEVVPLLSNFSVIALKSHAGRYLCAELGGGTEVVANRTSIGPWERFYPTTQLKVGEVAFRTYDARHYVGASAILGDPEPRLHAREVTPQPFLVKVVEADPVVGDPDLFQWPRMGCSIASCVIDRRYDLEVLANLYADLGVNLTRVNLLSALWPDTKDHMILPFGMEDGTYDLYLWQQEFFDRIDTAREIFNARGVVVHWTLYELYSWSNRKKGPNIPNANLGPWRNNINGVKWGGTYNGDRREDDATLATLPDDWSRAFLSRLVPHLGLHQNILQVGNEFPEKDLHRRVNAYVKAIQPDAQVSVNRQEDTPGQYENMKIGKEFEFIEFHGRLLKKVSDLARLYSEEPKYRTFAQMFRKSKANPKDIIFSSDGARSSNDPIETYDWDNLLAFVGMIKALGCSFDHQSRAKMTSYPNYHMIETDFIRKIRNA